MNQVTKIFGKNKVSCDAGYKLETKCTLEYYHFDNLSIEESVIRSLSYYRKGEKKGEGEKRKE
jgi:hypothetical protein